MRKFSVVSKRIILTLAGAVMVIGIAAVVQNPAQARKPPQPECGPTRQWTCVDPRCPDCPEVLFEGTVCEKAQYEKRTKRVCSPA